MPELIFRMSIKKSDKEEHIMKLGSQMKYCKKTNQPLFVPVGIKCHTCSKLIWENISLESASTKLITSCPNCGRSWCE